MNVAFPAIVLFVLLLPGFILRSRWKRIERTSIDYSPFGRAVGEAVLVAGTLHLAWLGLTWVLTGRVLDSELLLTLLAPNGRDAGVIAKVSAQAGEIAWYFVTLYAAATVMPRAVRLVISRCRLDREGHWLSPFARFHEAPWYYLLTGADFTKSELPDFVQVAAVMEVGGGAVLFTGTLEEWFVDAETGRLDRIVLSSVARRPLASDKHGVEASDPESRFYPIDGDYFVLRYEDMRSLNVRYVRLELREGQEEEEEDEDEEGEGLDGAVR